jgi:hypothetical protein
MWPMLVKNSLLLPEQRVLSGGHGDLGAKGDLVEGLKDEEKAH